MLIYRILSILLFPFIELYLIARILKKKEDKLRIRERLGHSGVARPKGSIVWIHAVSVGEANSALILVDEVLKFSPKISVLFTTTTLTSAAIIAAKLPQYNGRVIHQFLPVDSYFCVQNFLNFWQPRTAIFVESEIWPNLIFEARKRGILSFLVNGRMSEKSAKKWRFARLIGFRIFDYFAAIFAQTNDDKKRFQRLAKQEVLLYGNLKAQALNLFVDEQKLALLKKQIGDRKIFVAASTHKGEEEVVLQSFEKLKAEFSDLLLIIIPRHPNRSEEVKALFAGKKIAQRSRDETIEDSTEIYLADTLGELGIFYSLSDFAFVGGSLFAIGGHNPFEAIKLNCAVISGSHIFNFREIYEDLKRVEGCKIVTSEAELTNEVANFLSDKNLAKKTNENALSVIKASDNIAEKIVKKIDQILMIEV
jgi:3-deoxy-D-manno-octulosonic-acid transferase